ncbi:MAG TPA: hypothetical protein VJW73_00425 [Gemmatimonadaceae bacterium]|nr:hypothetical protein [Gemmatimonadaceae bacterium]
MPVARTRLRAYATSRDQLDLAAYRKRQIIGWRLSEANESFLFQPEYGETFDVEGARLLALIEPASAGSRVRGRLIVSPLTKIVIGVWMLTVAVVTFRALSLGEEAPATVLRRGALLLGAAVIFARYCLTSMSRRVEARLRERLEASPTSAAA